MKKLYSLITILLVCIVKAQITMPQVFPPVPNASSIAKNIEAEPNLYSGTIPISIPLFSFNNHQAKIDIFCSYNTKGVQLAENSSSIGLGWSLNYGGNISRQVRDKADEYINGYLSAFENVNNFETDERVRKDIYENLDLDSEPDMFFLNVGNISAKFIINPVTKKAILQSPSDIKINIIFQENTNSIDQFIVKDTNGINYYFGKRGSKMYYDENLKSYSGQIEPFLTIANEQENSSYKNGWMLTQVTDDNNNSIFFDYEYEEITLFSFYDQKDITNSYITSFNKNLAKQNRIKRISDVELKGGNEIIFDYTINRKDILGSKSLEKITLTSNNEIIKKILFDISEVKLDNYNINSKILDLDPNSSYRIFLNSIKEYKKDDTFLNKYSFQYFNFNLPNKHSKAIDYWGYYNGKISNNGYNLLQKNNIINRKVDLDFLKYGALQQITTPTKENIVIDYELHTAIHPTYFNNLLNITNSEDQNSEKVSFHCTSTTGNDTVKCDFEVKNHVDNKLYYNNFCKADICKDFGVFLYKSNGTLIKSLSTTSNEIYSIPINTGNYYIIMIAPATPSIYEFPVSYPLVLYYNIPKNNQNNTNFFGGGLRLKEILKKDSNKNIIRKQYKYSSVNDLTSGKLFDIPDFFYIFNRLNFNNVTATEYISNKIGNLNPLSQYSGNGNVGYSEVKEIIIDDSTNKSYSTITNYTNYFDGNTFYKFPMNVKDDLSWSRGLVLSTNFYNENNILIKSENNDYYFFDNKTSPYIAFNDDKKNKIDNNPLTYNQLNEPIENLLYTSNYELKKDYNIFPIYKFGNYVDSSNQINNFSHNDYRIGFFYGSQVKKIKSTTIENFDNETSITAETFYNYDSNNHLQLTKQTTKNSKGETLTTEYQYPPDLVGQEDYMKELTDANRIAEPIVVKQSVNGVHVSEVHNQYNLFNGIIQKAAVHQKKGNGINIRTTTDRKITYNSYDEKGNLTQYTLENGIPVSIIWGYNGQYPILKVEGVALKDIPQWLIDYLKSPSDAGHNTELATRLNYQRNEPYFKDAMVTGYVYQPLVGVTQIIQPNGQTEYYKYDAANRLEEIRNDKQEVLKTFEYNYKQP